MSAPPRGPLPLEPDGLPEPPQPVTLGRLGWLLGCWRDPRPLIHANLLLVARVARLETERDHLRHLLSVQADPTGQANERLNERQEDAERRRERAEFWKERAASWKEDLTTLGARLRSRTEDVKYWQDAASHWREVAQRWSDAAAFWRERAEQPADHKPAADADADADAGKNARITQLEGLVAKAWHADAKARGVLVGLWEENRRLTAENTDLKRRLQVAPPSDRDV